MRSPLCQAGFLAAMVGGWACGSSTEARADVVATDGAAIVAEPPSDISNNLWTSNTEIRVWFEREAMLVADLSLEHAEPGTVDDSSDLVPGLVGAGSTVQSYMIRLDPDTHAEVELSGSVTFERPILGVVLNPSLGSTDSILGRPGITYNHNNNRGLELDDGTPDAFAISPDRRTIAFTLYVRDGPTDDIRVVTASREPCRCAADVNCDGNVDPDDLGDFINCYFAIPPCDLAEFNGDGNVDPDDLGDFINAYFAGC